MLSSTPRNRNEPHWNRTAGGAAGWFGWLGFDCGARNKKSRESDCERRRSVVYVMSNHNSIASRVLICPLNCWPPPAGSVPPLRIVE